MAEDSTTDRLARAMLGELQRRVADGANPAALTSGVDQAVSAIVEELGNIAVPVSTLDQVSAIARTRMLRRPPGDPTEPDPDPEDAVTLSGLIANAIDKVGLHGPITVAESNNPRPDLELTEGLRFGNGLLSPYLATDTERMEAVLDNPYVLLSHTTLDSSQELIPLLEQVIGAGRPLLVVAEDVVGEALALLTVNKIRGVLAAAAVKAPGRGVRRAAILQDLAILTGAEIGETGTLRLDHLGSAGRVIVGREDTTIVDGAGDPARIVARMGEIRAELDEPLSDWDRQRLQDRLAALSAGVAVIKIGGSTQREVNSRLQATEDGLTAVREAVAEGVVEAGDLMRASERLDLFGDEAAGAAAVRAAISTLTETADNLHSVSAINSDLRSAAVAATTLLGAKTIGLTLPYVQGKIGTLGGHEVGEGIELRRPEIAGQED